MADPIIPNTPNVNGKVITIACVFTSTGAAQKDTCSLPTYAPLIDLRIGHPVISLALITWATNSTGSEAYYPANEMIRGTGVVYDPDGAGEWRIKGTSTDIELYHTTDDSGTLLVTYIAFGSQQA